MSNDIKLNWVYYLSVISVNQCSINNDFEGVRVNSNGVIYTTDVSRKYLMKRYMKDVLNINVAGLSSKNEEGINIYLKDNEKYMKQVEEIDDKKSSFTFKNFLNENGFIDIPMFGYIFSDTFNGTNGKKLSNASLTGYIQITNGINIGNNNEIINMDIINGNKNQESTDNKKSGSVGSKQIIEEAYIYNTIILNPNQFIENNQIFQNEKNIENNYKDIIEKLNKILSNDANSFRTASRNNIYNEVLIKIESETALNLGKNPIFLNENNKLELSEKLKKLEKEGKCKLNEILNELK